MKRFASRTDSDEYLLANPETVLAAVHFYRDTATNEMHFLLQHNTTVKYFKGNYQDPNMFVQVGLL